MTAPPQAVEVDTMRYLTLAALRACEDITIEAMWGPESQRQPVSCTSLTMANGVLLGLAMTVPDAEDVGDGMRWRNVDVTCRWPDGTLFKTGYCLVYAMKEEPTLDLLAR